LFNEIRLVLLFFRLKCKIDLPWVTLRRAAVPGAMANLRRLLLQANDSMAMRVVAVFLAVALLRLLNFPFLAAQEPPAPDAGPAVEQAEPAVAEQAVVERAADVAAQEAADEAKTEQAVREQTIYIPYAKLREVFEKEGRGVFLPYEKFQELWDAARDKPAVQRESSLPVDALITEAENVATVENDVVRVRATLTVELLKQGWNQVPLFDEVRGM
jgi:hypothetical protein